MSMGIGITFFGVTYITWELGYNTAIKEKSPEGL
jgi:hypothetical protein